MTIYFWVSFKMYCNGIFLKKVVAISLSKIDHTMWKSMTLIECAWSWSHQFFLWDCKCLGKLMWHRSIFLMQKNLTGTWNEQCRGCSSVPPGQSGQPLHMSSRAMHLHKIVYCVIYKTEMFTFSNSVTYAYWPWLACIVKLGKTVLKDWGGHRKSPAMRFWSTLDVHCPAKHSQG